jgi:hypothetical protein
MVPRFAVLLALSLAACSTGPVQDLASHVSGDAATAASIAADMGPQSDAVCYDAIRQAATDLGPGNTVGGLAVEAIKRAITSNPTSPCLPIFLDLYTSVMRGIVAIHGL